MKAMILLTKDIYLRLGFESITGEVCNTQDPSIAIMDDGVRFLYFLDMSSLRGKFPPAREGTDFFLKRLRLVIPRDMQRDEISNFIHLFQQDKFQINCLSQRERLVLLDMSQGKSPKVLNTNTGMAYKTWHNFKATGFKRLGIKNNITFINAIHSWYNWIHSSDIESFFTKKSNQYYY